MIQRTAAPAPQQLTLPNMPAPPAPKPAPQPAKDGIVGPWEPGTKLPAMPTPPRRVRPVADPTVPLPGRLDDPTMRKGLDELLKTDRSARVAVHPVANNISFVAGSFPLAAPPKSATPAAPDTAARLFLREHGTAFGIANPDRDLRLQSLATDDLGQTHARYQQVYKNLPVFGQELVVHHDDDSVRAVNGQLTPNIDVPVTPTLSAKDAFENVRRARNVDGTLTDKALGIYTLETGEPRLAWELMVRGESAGTQIYVDARTGRALDAWGIEQPILQRETFDAKNRTSPGQVARKEGDGPVEDSVVNAAHDNAGTVYDYFMQRFNRDSLDNRGMKLSSTVHYGTNYNNAYWDGRQMTYGDGDGKLFTPLAKGLDVVGHEMAHGVTERTAALRYSKQSGALNESWSDVFGELIEQWREAQQPTLPLEDFKKSAEPDWLVGEDVFTPDTPGDAIRSIKAPGTSHPNDPQPAHMKDYKDITWDNGGVHINSGIPNKAAYEIAQKIGTDKLAQVWYRSLTNYLTKTSQFQDAANVTSQAAIDLFGTASPEYQAVVDGWKSVGLVPAGATRNNARVSPSTKDQPGSHNAS